MRLIRCKKCGSAITTEDGLIERMNDTIHDLNEKARRSKDGRVAKSYLAEAASVTKMMKGIIHSTAQIEERKNTLSAENAVLVHYLINNNLITWEKLDELREIARQRAEAKNKEDQARIDQIYGKYTSLYTPSNNTKADPTAKAAISNINK